MLIAPVALSVGHDERSVGQLRAFGKALAGVPGDFLVVASTDLNHYEDQKTTVEKDEAVIRAIDPSTLGDARTVGRKRLPTTVVGLLTHIAEHTQRHVGQAIAAAKLAAVLR